MTALYVLVGGWPASGKSTLASALAVELGIAYLSKDAIKLALMDALGAPRSVEESRRLGVAAVHAVLRAAQDVPGAVLDSTWFDYTKPLVGRLAGHSVEVRCHAPIDTVRARFLARVRDERHIDGLRSVEELWGSPVPPLGIGPLIDVDTSRTVDIPRLAARIQYLSAR
jgi:predicted kinase